VVSYYSPSGGGYGDPLDRDPAKVLDDVLDGFFGPDHAKSDYGVVLMPVDDGYDWGLDEAATANLRAEMRA
jgi:N-methylhydantoinase B